MSVLGSKETCFLWSQSQRDLGWNPKGYGLPVTAAHIYVVRYFIEKKRGGMGGEQRGMTDPSGDRDYAIHGSLAFSVSLPESCKTQKTMLYLYLINCNLQPFLVFR